MNDAARLEGLIREMAEASGKAMKAARVEFYMRKLRPHIGPELFKLLDDLADQAELPSPMKIKAQLNNRLLRARQQQGPPEMKPMTAEERKRSDYGSIMSILWMHYEYGWKLDDFGFLALARQLATQGRQEILDAVEKAKQQIPREEVYRWMEEHK